MPRKGVPYGGAICSLPSAVQSVNGQTGAVKLNAAHIPSDGSSNVQADLNALRASIMRTVTAANTINLPANTPYFDVVSVTAPITGRAIVNIRGKFGNNSAGYRLVGYAKNTTSEQTEWIFNTNSNSDNLYYSVPLIIDVNAGDVIHGCAFQTSGSTLDVTMGITMMIYPM